MKTIPLNKGMVALVDDEDYERLSQFRWTAWQASGRPKSPWYARRSGPRPKRGVVYMHRQILELSDPKIEADHRDGNGLNNQRRNLRSCTKTQNRQNQKPLPNTSSKYKGVSREKGRRLWAASITVAGNRTPLGTFDEEKDAADAYDAAAREHFGEFAYTNARARREGVLPSAP